MAGVRITNLRIDTKVARSIIRGNSTEAQTARSEVGRAIARTAASIVPRSDRNPPHQHLADNIRLVGGRSGSLIVRADVDHATAYHQGSGPHPIVARNFTPAGYNSPQLVFWWSRANTLFIGPRVNHPGYRGFPFFEIACTQLGIRFHRAAVSPE